MRFIPAIRKKNEEVAPVDRVRKIGSLDVYAGVDPDDVIRRLRSMTYGSTSAYEVKRRLANNEGESTLHHPEEVSRTAEAVRVTAA